MITHIHFISQQRLGPHLKYVCSVMSWTVLHFVTSTAAQIPDVQIFKHCKRIAISLQLDLSRKWLLQTHLRAHIHKHTLVMYTRTNTYTQKESMLVMQAEAIKAYMLVRTSTTTTFIIICHLYAHQVWHNPQRQD